MKKILVLALAGFILAGCARNTQGTMSTENQAPQETETQAPQQTETQAPQQTETEAAVDVNERNKNERNKEDDRAPTQDTSKAAVGPATDLDLSFVQAVDIFKGEFSDGVVTSVELEKEDRGWIYELEGHSSSREYKLDINAQPKEIIDSEVENDDDEDDEEVNVNEALTIAEIYDIAKKEGLGEIDHIDLDNDDGRDYIDIEDISDKEIEINARTGEVVEKDF